MFYIEGKQVQKRKTIMWEGKDMAHGPLLMSLECACMCVCVHRLYGVCAYVCVRGVVCVCVGCMYVYACIWVCAEVVSISCLPLSLSTLILRQLLTELGAH